MPLVRVNSADSFIERYRYRVSIKRFAQFFLRKPHIKTFQIKSVFFSFFCRLPLAIAFDELGISVILPVSLVEIHKVMRVLWMSYDHWTDRCRSFENPPLPDFYKRGEI